MQDIDLLSAMASEPRLEILQMLKDSNLKSAEIAKQANMSIQALGRHLDKLSSSNLIQKMTDGAFCITPLAKTCLSQIPFFDFLSKHNDFFLSNTFDGIPDHLLSRIGDLNGGELESNPMKAVQRARDVYVNSKEFFHACAYAIPIEIFDDADNKLEHKVDYKILVGKNTSVPKGFYSHTSRKAWENYASKGYVEERYIQHVPINIVVTEIEAHVIFAKKELGQPSEPLIFFGKDELFRNWCIDMFSYYWNEIPKIPKFKLQEY